MTKQEFLSGLETALSGEVSQQVFLENMRYYQGYIEDELQKGRSEAEVLEELGSPRLIARTIIDAAEAEEEAETGRFGFSGGFGRETQTDGQYGPESGSRGGYGDGLGAPGGLRGFRMGTSGCLILALILMVALFFGIHFVIASVFRLVYAFPGLVILGILFYIFSSRRNGRR